MKFPFNIEKVQYLKKDMRGFYFGLAVVHTRKSQMKYLALLELKVNCDVTNGVHHAKDNIHYYTDD